MRGAGPLFLAILFTPISVASGASFGWMVELKLDGRQIEGAPLAWDRDEVHLLARDGRLWEFPPQDATDYRKTSDRFRAYSPSEFRAELLRELGSGIKVSGTGHYLVAHPAGQRDKWAQRFEDLYRSFVHYFAVRGFRPKKPPCLLVGVVCRNREEFARYSARRGIPVGGGLLGYYSLESNRIILYDVRDQYGQDAWQKTASIIIHEATHQTAFNTGVHSRWAPPPVWVAEGLATMFEAPGVYDSRHWTTRADRINQGRLRAFRKLAPRHKPELLQAIIASDRSMLINPTAGYAEAWALTFYLVETQPRKYMKYLARTSARPAFTEYTPAERMADFVAVFGDQWLKLERDLLQFIAALD